jgi:predicted ester cyclase
MSNSQLEAHFRNQWDRLWHTDETEDAFDELLAESFQMQISSLPEPLERSAWLQFVKNWKKAFPDGRMDIEELICQGDTICCYWVSTGTHSQEYLGIPATNNQVRYFGVDIYRMKGNKAIDCRAVPDVFSLMHQLGAIKN